MPPPLVSSVAQHRPVGRDLTKAVDGLEYRVLSCVLHIRSSFSSSDISWSAI